MPSPAALKTSNKNGSALLHVILAVGLVALISVGVTSTLSQMQSTEKNESFNENLDALVAMVYGTISTPQICSSLIRFNPDQPYDVVNTQNMAELNIRLGLPFYRSQQQQANDSTPKNPTYPFEPNLDCLDGPFTKAFPCADEEKNTLPDLRLKIDNISFVQTRPYTEADNNTPNPGQRTYVGSLRLTASSQIPGDLSLSTREFARINFVVDNTTGKFIGCYAEQSAQNSCESLGGVYNESLSPRCRIGFHDADCSNIPGTYIKGIRPDGSVICESKEFKCDDTQGKILVGVVNGVPVCRDYVPRGAAAGFQWVENPWSACSSSCGSGTRSKTYACKNTTGVIVADSYCSGSKPATQTEICNTTTCKVNFNTTNSSLPEGASVGVLVSLQAVRPTNTTVTFAVKSTTTATAGSDYSWPGTTMIIPAGSTSGTHIITTNKDALAEGNEVLNLYINSATGTAVEPGPLRNHTVTIVNVMPVSVCGEWSGKGLQCATAPGTRETGHSGVTCKQKCQLTNSACCYWHDGTKECVWGAQLPVKGLGCDGCRALSCTQM